MKVLIAGINGFLGSALREVCLENSDEVWALEHSSPISLVGLKGSVVFGHAPLLEQSYDCIFLAAGNYQQSKKALIEANQQLAAQCADLYPTSKIVYVSSTEVYGNSKAIITERTPPHPVTSYGEAKIETENIVTQHQRYAVIRLTVLYGKHLSNASFLPTVIKSAQQSKKIALTNYGERQQDYMHVLDAAVLCYKAAHHPENELFLGATGSSLSNQQVAEKICDLVQGCQIEYSGTSNATSSHYDPTFTVRTLSWLPKYGLLEFLSEMVKP